MAKLATLTPEEEQKLRQVEDDLGDVYVIAYEKPLEPAPLDDGKLRKLQQAEAEMPGLILVAYRKA
jgi:hypothetical protein